MLRPLDLQCRLPNNGRGMTETLPCVEVPPSGGEAKSSVIWLHGLGASGHDFEPIVPMLGLENTRFVFPHAPERSVTINAGMVMPAWYDIRSLEDIAEREPEDHVLHSACLVEALIAREKQRGVPASQIVLAGFSQGGAIALHVGVRHAQSLAGIMVLSAYLLMGDRLEAEANPANLETPYLQCHGRLDPLVPIAGGKQAFERISALNPKRAIQWHDFQMGHEVCPEQIGIIARWLKERVA